MWRPMGVHRTFLPSNRQIGGRHPNVVLCWSPLARVELKYCTCIVVRFKNIIFRILFYSYSIVSKIADNLHELKAPKRAKSIQYVWEKNIQPWMSCNDSSVFGSWNQRAPAIIPKPIVCNQLRRDNIRGRASLKFRCDKTYFNQLKKREKREWIGISRKSATWKGEHEMNKDMFLISNQTHRDFCIFL